MGSSTLMSKGIDTMNINVDSQTDSIDERRNLLPEGISCTASLYVEVDATSPAHTDNSQQIPATQRRWHERRDRVRGRQRAGRRPLLPQRPVSPIVLPSLSKR
jgi:hypothetical protein